MGRIFKGPHALEHLAVVLSIFDYRRPDLPRGPSVEFLAVVAGLEPEVFSQRLSELREQGWIEATGPSEAITIGVEGLLEKIKEETPDEE